MPNAPGPLGWIEPANRTPEQELAHAAAIGKAKRFTLPMPPLAKGQALRLFDLWKHPDVVVDVGFVFERIHQISGSCVWAGGTNALYSTICAQRLAADNPTQAFLPFTLHNYAMSRHYFGDDNQGEGSLGSTFFKSLDEDGVREWPEAGDATVPGYTKPDGIMVTKKVELKWSSFRNPDVQRVVQTTQTNTIASVGECRNVSDIRAMILNGYGVSFACNNYIGNGQVRGTGDKARVMGKWDGQGGHQQSIHAVEEHPDFGPIYLALNNWPGNTYPTLPTQPECSTWVLEADVEKALRMDAEVYGLSSLDWFPAQPRLLSWIV